MEKILVGLILVAIELAVAKYFWLNYGTFAAILAIFLGGGLIIWLSVFPLAMASVLLGFDKDAVKPHQTQARLWLGASAQFAKSFILSNILFIVFNVIALAYVAGMDPDGTSMRIVTSLELVFVIYFSIQQSREYLRAAQQDHQRR